MHRQDVARWCPNTYLNRCTCVLLLLLLLRNGANAQYKAEPKAFLNKLRGMFAIILYDAETDDFLVARDHIGICPLYIGWSIPQPFLQT